MDSNETTSREFLSLEDPPDFANDIRNKIINNTYRISNMDGRSKVWETFGRIETEDGREIANYMACRKCLKCLKFNKKSTSNLIRHKCSSETRNDLPSVSANIDLETKKTIEDLITKWQISDPTSVFDIVCDSGLKRLITHFLAIGAKYGPNVNAKDILPTAEGIKLKMEKLYYAGLQKLKSEINSIRNIGYSLTADIWSDKHLNATFLFITIHYTRDGEVINRYLGMDSIEHEKCKSDDIKEAAQEILEIYDITLENDNIILTNNSENMVEAFLSNNRVYCINHLLNSTVEEAIDKTSEIRELYDTSAKLYSYLIELNETFNETAEDIFSNRWNRTYYMLSSLGNNWNEAIEICSSNDGEDSQLIHNLNLNHINALVNILKPFEESFNDLNNENSATLHLVIVHLHHLKKLCVKNHEDLDIIKKFKVNLLASFDNFLTKNISLQHKIALFLFPPTNQLLTFNETDKDLIRGECKQLMKTFIDETQLDENIDMAQSTIQIDDKDAVMEYLPMEYSYIDTEEAVASTSAAAKYSFELFSDFIKPKGSLSCVDKKINSEILTYEATNIPLQENFNPLEWWHLNQEKFPLLYKVSCKILAVPATSMSAENVILKARPLIYRNRGDSEDPDLINETLFLHFNMDENEILNM